MKTKTWVHSALIDVDDSILIVIDVQDCFLKKLPERERIPLIDRIRWLIGVATRLNIPIIVTAEDIPNCGSITNSIKDKLPSDIPIHNKMVFALTEEPHIMSALEQTGRKTAILVGLETDVCVAHSAIGLLQRDYAVVVVADATASPGVGHEFGLERARGAGALITTVKGVFYEWTRTVYLSEEFTKRYASELPPPNGVIL